MHRNLKMNWKGECKSGKIKFEYLLLKIQIQFFHNCNSWAKYIAWQFIIENALQHFNKKLFLAKMLRTVWPPLLMDFWDNLFVYLTLYLQCRMPPPLNPWKVRNGYFEWSNRPLLLARKQIFAVVDATPRGFLIFNHHYRLVYNVLLNLVQPCLDCHLGDWIGIV